MRDMNWEEIKNNPPEILLVDKPYGVSSFAVVAATRRQLEVKKVGHAGTLDPLATGLMVLGIGTGTKKLTELIKLDKEYVAEVRFGEARTTDDMEGEVTEVTDGSVVTKQAVETALKKLVGEIELPVSAYSAIKKNGVPFYKKARKAALHGETLPPEDLPMRLMKVYEAELLQFSVDIENNRSVATVRFAVGSGTYIRSLAKALGASLAQVAVLQNLRRTKVGRFVIDDAVSIEIRGQKEAPVW